MDLVKAGKTVGVLGAGLTVFFGSSSELEDEEEEEELDFLEGMFSML